MDVAKNVLAISRSLFSLPISVEACCVTRAWICSGEECVGRLNVSSRETCGKTRRERSRQRGSDQIVDILTITILGEEVQMDR